MGSASEPMDGLQYAYRYRDAATGLCELTCDERVAAREARGPYEVVLAKFRDGRLARVPEMPPRGDAPPELLCPRARDGRGHVFRYADPRTGGLVYTLDETLAQLASGGDYQRVWAHFSDGHLARLATRDEMRHLFLGRVEAIITERLVEMGLGPGSQITEEVRWKVRRIMGQAPQEYLSLVTEALAQARDELGDAVVADDVAEEAWRFPDPTRELP